MSLFSILGSTAHTLGVFNAALNVSQNNVANASTPGYARETQSFTALPFNLADGTTGGVAAGELQSARDSFAERNVQTQNGRLGASEQQVASLTDLQNNFDITGKTGIPSALNGLSAAFSGWSLSPNNATARQNVIQAAQTVAGAFQTTAANVAAVAADNRTQLKSIVSQINSYASQIQADNVRIQAGGKNDAGLSADLSSKIESLSEIANVTTLKQPDGTVTVLLGGQNTLVAGSQQYPVSASLSVPAIPPPTYPSAPPGAQILDAHGNDITGTVTGGKLGGILTVLNQTLPAITGSAAQPGSLNQLAKSFADSVNGILSAGNVTDGPPVQTGVPLFSYDATNGTNAAASLTLDPGATAAGLAAITPANPAGTPPTSEISNGTALTLAGLVDSANKINGQSYTQFFGGIAANVGTALSAAKTGQSLQTSLLAQARSLRDQSSGVDLNQEAINVVELQRSYQAATKLLSVVDALTQSILELIK